VIKIKIPNELNPGGSLRVIIKVGTLGFTRTEILRNWEPGGNTYVDPDYTSVEFSKVGQTTGRILVERTKPK
jgi:hypothetical protein